jgi:hypothetical protein
VRGCAAVVRRPLCSPEDLAGKHAEILKQLTGEPTWRSRSGIRTGPVSGSPWALCNSGGKRFFFLCQGCL